MQVHEETAEAVETADEAAAEEAAAEGAAEVAVERSAQVATSPEATHETMVVEPDEAATAHSGANASEDMAVDSV